MSKTMTIEEALAVMFYTRDTAMEHELKARSAAWGVVCAEAERVINRDYLIRTVMQP